MWRQYSPSRPGAENQFAGIEPTTSRQTLASSSGMPSGGSGRPSPGMTTRSGPVFRLRFSSIALLLFCDAVVHQVEGEEGAGRSSRLYWPVRARSRGMRAEGVSIEQGRRVTLGGLCLLAIAMLESSGARFAERALRNIRPGSRGSLRLHARELDHLGPLLGFLRNEFPEIGGRAWKHSATKVGKARLDFGIVESRVDLLIELVNNLGRRVPGNANAIPRCRLAARFNADYAPAIWFSRLFQDEM